MKKLILLATVFASMVNAQVTIPRLNRKVETSAPQDIQLQLRRGETVDLSIQFTSYATVMDLTGATVTLHAITNGMTSGTSFQVSGTATSNGTATVRIVTDTWLPSTLTTGTWTMEVSQPSLSRIMRASGDLRVTGLVYPSAASPLPVSWATNLWSAIGAIQSRTNDWETAFRWGNHAGLYLPISWLPDWNSVTNKPLTFAPSPHEHSFSSITNAPWLIVQTQQLWVANAGTAGTVTGIQSQLLFRAWQNPASATNWTWTSDGKEITLTGYNGPNDVIIPNMLDGLPVTTLNQTFSVYDAQQDEYIGRGITSVKGGSNLKTVMASSFRNCGELLYVDLNSVTNIEMAAFFSCTKLRSLNIDSIVNIGESAFDNCISLPRVTLPTSLQTIGPFAFAVREAPLSPLNLYFNGSAPSLTGDPAIFDSRPSVTNYVTNPTATGWGSTFGGMAVVRNSLYGAGDGITGITAAQVGAYGSSNPSNYFSGAQVTNAIGAAQAGNLIVNLTTNKTTAFTFAPTNATYLGDCTTTVLPSAGSISVPIGTNGNYAFAWGCTNSTFTSIEGTYADVELYCAENDAGDQTAKVEIYRRDILTNTMTEWGDGGETFTVPSSATPQIVNFKIWLPPVSTNAFRVWARIKRIGGTATSARLLIVGSGTGTPTHFSMTVPASVPISIHNSDVGAHPSILSKLSPSVWTNQTWGALGTNATYRMSWDVTNGTFKVEEILP